MYETNIRVGFYGLNFEQRTHNTHARQHTVIESSQFMWLFIDEIVKILLIFFVFFSIFSIMHQVEIIWAKLRAFPNIRQ